MTRFCWILVSCAGWASAQVCAPANLEGAYGFQLAGTSTISGNPTPISSVGRLVFETGRRTLSGYASVNFNGFFLGNPITGDFEVKSDCSVVWKLQDDSGAFQHFKGTMRPGGRRIDFEQTDPRSGARGVLMKLADTCSAAALRGRYSFSIFGTTTPFAAIPPVTVSETATVVADGNGALVLTRNRQQSTGTYAVDSDCFVMMDVENMRLRGVLVNNGDDVPLMQTDPHRVGAARLTRLPQ